MRQGTLMKQAFWRFYRAWNRVVYTFTGPAQIGAGYAEGPDVRPSDPDCPMCGAAMSTHRLERSSGQYTPTRLHCPA